jgi:hypothetical protein
MHWQDPRAGSRPDESPPDEPDQLEVLVIHGPFGGRDEAEEWLADYREHRQSDGRDDRDTGDTDTEIIVAGDDGELLEDSGDETTPLDEAIEALERVDWTAVDTVSPATAAVFHDRLVVARNGGEKKL